MKSKRAFNLVRTGSPAACLLAGALAALFATHSASAGNGIWTNNGSGTWSTTTNWAGLAEADGTGFTADFSTIDITIADRTVSLDTARTIGNLTFGDANPASACNWILDNNGNGLNVLTLDATTPTIKVNALGTGKTVIISAELAGVAGVTKSGAGALTLTAANSYTGLTRISGGTLSVGDGITGSLNGTTGTALTFTGSGTFNVFGADSSTQGMGLLTMGAGDGTVSSTFQSTAATLTFADVAARGANGGTCNFALSGGDASTNKIVLTNFSGGVPATGTLLDKGVFFGGSSYATYDVGGFLRAYATTDADAATAAAGASTIPNDATKNVFVTGTITAQTAAAVNTLNLVANNVTLPNTSTILQTNGLVATGGSIISGLIQPAVAGGEIVVRVNSGETKISSVIQNNTSASTLTKVGAGTLYLLPGNNANGPNPNTFSGGATLAQGTVKTGSVGNNPLGTGPLTILGGTALSIAGNNIMTFNNASYNLNGDFSVISSGGNTCHFSTGGITLGASNKVTVTGLTLNFNGTISDGGNNYGLIKDGANPLGIASAANTFTGKTVVLGGTLNPLTIGNVGANSSLGAPATVADATIDMYNGTSLRTAGFSQTNSTTDRVINLAGTGPGTVTIFVQNNDTFLTLNSAPTATGAGPKTLALSVNGDRPGITVNAGIADGADASPLSLAATVAGNDQTAGAGRGINLNGVNTFTGPLSVTAGAGALTIGGAGQLGSGTYANTITLTGGKLVFNSTATQTLSGLISGTGGLTMSGAGTLTLPNANTFSGLTTVSGGTLVLGHDLALQNSALTSTAGGVTLSGTTPTFGGLAGSRALDTTISTGYTGVTALTLNPGAGASNTYSGVVADGAPGMTLIKTGLGIQVFSGNNLYTGATTINAGTLQLGTGTAGQNGSIASTSVVDNATLTFNNADAQSYAGDISGTGLLTKTGAGTLALAGTNSYAAGTFVNAGVLQFDTPGAIAGAGRSITVTAPGAVTLGYLPAGSLQSDLLDRIVVTSTGSVALSAAVNLAENLDFSAFPALSLGTLGSLSYTGTLTPNGTTYRLGGGGGTLTFTPTSYDTTKDLVINGNGLTGTVDFGGLSKTFGAITVAGGTLQNGTLTGSSFNLQGGTVTATLDGVGAALTKTGAGTLTFNGTAPETFTGGVIVNAGILVENFANLTPPTDLFNSGNALTLGGGTLSLIGQIDAASSQTFASTALTSNTASKITLAKTGTGTMTVDLKAITRNPGSFLNFTVVPDATNLFALTTNANTNNLLGPWATVGATTTLQYAANNGSNQIVALGAAGTTAATAGGTNLVDVTSDATNYTYAAAATLGGAKTGNTLRYTGAATTTALGTNSLTLNGLMNAGTNTLTISGTAGNPGLVIGANGELDIVSNDKNITISSVISGTGAVVFSGGTATATLALSGVNTYVGGTTLVSGTISLTAAATVLGTGPVTLMPGTTLAMSNASLANSFTITDASITSGNSFGGALSGPITLGGTLTLALTNEGNEAISSNISGSGGLTHRGVRLDNLTALSGTNTYTGVTTIASSGTVLGALKLTNRVSLYNADTTSWTAEKIIVNPGAVAVFAVGGATQFTASDITTLAGLGTATGGFASGSFIGLDTTSGNYSADSVIANPNGGANVLGVNKFGNNTLTLTGASSYTGQTRIYRGSLMVASINSVVGGNPTSNMGAPLTVANGTIIMGLYGQAGTLIYTGADETTDRVLALNNAGGGGGSGGAIITQSGTGLLKFTSDFSVGTLTGKTITFQGSTSGTGEFAGAIPGTGIAVTKNGTGTWTLSGANSYTGVTTVSQGKLLVNGTNGGTGAVTVSANAALGGTGTIAGNTTVASSGKLAFNLSTAAASHDQLDIAGSLTFAGASVLDITASGTLPAPGVYTLATAAGGINGDAPATVNLPPDWAATASISGDGKSLLLDVTTVAVADYDAWAGPGGYNLTGGRNGDDDGDGLSNFKEYAFGLNPTSAASVNPISQPLDQTTGLFKYTRRATPATTGVTYTYESSTTLSGTWPGFTPDSEVSNNATPVEEITVEVPDALLLNPTLFLRVKAQ